MNRKILLAVVFIAVFAASRIPQLMPSNFAVVYAFAFCSGVFFKGRQGWWIPLAVIFITDLGLNFYYQHTNPAASVWSAANLANLGFNYLAYLALIFLGRRFKPQSSLLHLVGGGLFGATLFYLITNTAAWLFNPFHAPEYTRTFVGWITALTKGTTGYPSTWEFFRNTLLSGGLFTALLGAAGKLTAESPADKNAGAREPAKDDEAEAEPEAEPKESKA